MKKAHIVLAAVVGILAIGVGYWLISPFFFTKTVDEALPIAIPVTFPTNVVAVPSTTSSVPEVQVLYQGAFTGFDAIHHGTGTASIIRVGDKSYVRFEKDFVVGNGPDLFVGFGKDGTYIKGSEVGALKGDRGSQNYELTEGFDEKTYNEVWIWCRAFSVPFAKATLTK